MDIRVTLSAKAFIAQLESVSFDVVNRFDEASRAGLIPKGITSVIFAYDFDVPTGVFRVFHKDQMILSIETPLEQLAKSPVCFHAKWLDDGGLIDFDLDDDLLGGGWYVTTSAENQSMSS